MVRVPGFAPRRSRGQNFLMEPQAAARLVDATACGPTHTVLEVGPGTGILTRLLVDTGANVVAVENDRALAAFLRDALGVQERFQLIEGDILRQDWAKLPLPAPRVLLTNLPFAITTPFLMKLFGSGLAFDRIVVTVQKEVAARMMARVGQRIYGRLAVLVSLWGKVERLFDLPPRLFRPRPKVVTTALALREHPSHPDFVHWRGSPAEAVIRAAFGARRKQVGKAVAEGLAMDRSRVHAAMDAVGIDPTLRAEMLAPEAFLALARDLEPDIPAHQLSGIALDRLACPESPGLEDV